MSRIDNLIKELCPNGVSFSKLQDVATVSRGKRVTKKDLSADGDYPVFQNSLIPLGFYDDCNYPANTTFVICAGAAGEIGFSDKCYWGADDCFSILCGESLNNRFVYHFLLRVQPFIKSNVRKASIPRLSADVIKNIRIPVPPLEVQREIVRVLDSFAHFTEELTANISEELKARKKQYEYYIDCVFFHQIESKDMSLSDLVEIKTGKLNANARTDDGEYPFFTCDAKPYRIDKYAFDTEAILVSGNGSQIGHVNYFNGKFNAYQRTYVFTDFKNVAPKYLLLYLKRYIREYCMANSKKGSVPYITLPMLEQFLVPIPSLKRQHVIVEILSNFDNCFNIFTNDLFTEIEARKQQYEYYRDKLLSFKELQN